MLKADKQTEQYTASPDQSARRPEQNQQSSKQLFLHSTGGPDTLKSSETQSAQDRKRNSHSAYDKQLEKRVAERTKQINDEASQLRELVNQLIKDERSKRNHLSKQLHENIQQLIAAARIKLSCVKIDEGSGSGEYIRGAEAILLQALDAMNLVAHELCPPVLYESGLLGGLEWIADHMKKKNFNVILAMDEFAEPAKEDIRLLLFECACELLFNAVKHSQVSEAKLALRRIADRHLELTVSDNGVGFDPELPDHRRHNERALGLFGIQERLVHVGGRMQIKSAPGEGASFTIIVPGACSTILICDDHATLREVFVRHINRSNAGLKVIGQAADGKTAIKLVRELSPDIVIMDVSLGDMNGIEATRQIMALNPKTKVIGLSMHDDESISRAMLDAGAIAYLNKSGPLEDFIAAIEAAAKEDGNSFTEPK